MTRVHIEQAKAAVVLVLALVTVIAMVVGHSGAGYVALPVVLVALGGWFLYKAALFRRLE